MGFESTTANVELAGQTTTTSMSELTIGATGLTLFAGLNGTPTGAGPSSIGFSATGINLALALFSDGAGNSYYGVAATAASLGPVGLPSAITVSGTLLNVEVNGSNNSNVVNFDAFNPGTGLAVVGSTLPLDYTASLIEVQGNFSLGVANEISIGGGFSFTDTANLITIDLGAVSFTGADPFTFSLGSFFTATGSLSMTISPTTFTLVNATLTVGSTLTLGSILSVTGLSVTVSDLSIDLSTGVMSGVTDSSGTHDPTLTINAASASMFPGNSTISGSVSALAADNDNLGFKSTFDLSTGAFSITLEHTLFTIGSVMTVTSNDVLLTYDPNDTDPHQQLVQVGSGTLLVNVGSGSVSGNITNLTIYKDGFSIGSVTVTVNTTITLGPLKLTNPTVTLTDFSATFSGGNADFSETGSLTVGVSSASLTVGSLSATVTGLAVTISLDPGTLGQTTVTVTGFTLTFSTYLNLSATNVTINPYAAVGSDYLTVGTASVTMTIGSLTIGGSASNFSIENTASGPAFDTSNGFSITLTPPSPSSLGLPSWLGFSITQFGIIWPNGLSDPTNFQLTLSAGITSISGVPDGLTVSGTISDVIINVGELSTWLSNPTMANFPISFGPSGGIGGSVSGTLFGMQISAAFVGGIVQFNQEGGIFTAPGVVTGASPSDTTVYGQGFYVGIQGSATIPGMGTVTISLGFSNLGPLSFYLSYQAEEPLIIDPDTGIALGGLAVGVAFDQTMQVPTSATALPTVMAAALTSITGSPTGTGSVNVATWQLSLEQATVKQYLNGGSNGSGFFSQPIMLLGSVTLTDAYVGGDDAFELTGTVILAINPQATGSQPPVAILVEGSLMLGGSSGFSGANGYLYGAFSGGGASFYFLVNEPGSFPIESFGGGLTFQFTQNGNPWTHSDTGSPNGFTLSLSGFFQYSALGFASVSIQGTLTIAEQPGMITIDLAGDVNVSFLGDLGDASAQIVLLFNGATYAATPAGNGVAATTSFTNNSGNIEIYGALDLYTGSAEAKLANYGLFINGAALFQINTTNQNVEVNLPPPPTATAGTQPTPFVIQSSVVFEMSLTGTTSTYATVAYVPQPADAIASNTNYSGGTVSLTLAAGTYMWTPGTNDTSLTVGVTTYQAANGPAIFTTTSSQSVTLNGSGNMAVSGSIKGGASVFDMQAFMDLRLTNNNGNLGLQIFADINPLTIGPPSAQFLSFTGFGIIIINNQGLVADIGLNISSGTNPIPDFSFNANFSLVLNTTSQTVTFTVPQVVVPGAPGELPPAGIPIYNGGTTSIGTVTTLIIPAGPPQGTLEVAGNSTANLVGTSTYATATTGSYVVSNLAAGTYTWTPGTSDTSLTIGGTTYQATSGAVTFTTTGASSAVFVGTAGLPITGTLITDWLPANASYTSGSYTTGTLQAGTYNWTPGSHDTSLTVDGVTYLASNAVSGNVTITVTTAATATLAGTTGTVNGKLTSEAILASTSYTNSGSASISSLPAGTYIWMPGSNDQSLTINGTTYTTAQEVNGEVIITTTATGTATFVGTAGLAVTGTLTADAIPGSTSYSSSGAASISSLAAGTYIWTPGSDDTSLTVGGHTYQASAGAVTFTLATAGAATFAGTDSSLVNGTLVSDSIPGGTAYSGSYNSSGTASIANVAVGTYVWTPGNNDTSLTIDGTTYLASSKVSGHVTVTVTSLGMATLVGTAGSAITGTLTSQGIPTNTSYSNNGYLSIANLPVGTYTWTPGTNDTSLTIGGVTYLASAGAVTFTTTVISTATLVGTKNASVSGTLIDEAVPANTSYNGSGSSSVNLAPATYTWTPGSHDTSLTFNGQTYTTTTTFTVVTAGVATLAGTDSATVNGTLIIEGIPASSSYNGSGSVNVTNLAAGTYTWTPGSHDTSLTINGITYLATAGAVTFTTVSTDTATFVGTANATVNGSLVDELIPTGTNYNTSGSATVSSLAAGTYTWTPGTGDTSLTVGGNTYLASGGVVTFTTTSSGAAVFVGTANATIAGTLVSMLVPVGTNYNTSGTATVANVAPGTYVWTPGTHDTSLTIDGTTYLASSAVNGKVIITAATGGTATLVGTANSVITGTLVSESVPGGAAYSSGSFTTSSLVAGTYTWTPGANDTSLTVNGTTYQASNGPVIFTLASAGTVTLGGTKNTSVTATIYAAGTYGNVGATGPYIVVQGSGSLTLFAGTSNELDMSGFFYFQISYSTSGGFLLQLAVQVTATISGLGKVTITGAMQITSAGVVALLEVSGQAGTPTSYGANISFNINAELAINTTNATVFNIGGVTLNGTTGIVANSFYIVASGTMTLSFGGGTLVISGIFSFDTNTSGSGQTYLASGGAVTFTTTSSGSIILQGTANTAVSGTLLNGTTEAIPVNTSYNASGSATITLAAGTYKWTPGANDTSLTTGGTTAVSTTTITAAGTLTATVNGTTILTMTANGVLQFVTGPGATGTGGAPAAGMAGQLTLTLSGSNPLSGTGFDFNGTFTLQLNTTGYDVTVNEPNVGGTGTTPVTIDGGADNVSIPAGSTTAGGFYVEIIASGSLTFGSSTNGFILNNGSFFMSISSTGFAISASATMEIVVGGSTLFSLSASGAMVISTSGFAAELTVTSSITSTYFAFNGTFELEVNTTGVQQTVNTVTIAAGPKGSTTGGAFFQMYISGTLTIGSGNTDPTSNTFSGIYMSGSFYLQIDSSGLEIGATTTLYLTVSGANVFSLTANGALLITSSGIAAEINLTFSAGSSGNNFSFNAGVSALLEINSTGAPIPVIAGVAVNLPMGPFFEVMVTGGLSIAGFITVSGSFTLTVDSSGVEVQVSASLSMLGNLFTVSGAAGFYSDGFALSINLELGGSSSPQVTIIPGVLTLTGSFNLQINTTGSSHFEVNPGTLFNVSVSASFNVFGFSLATGSFNIYDNNGFFAATGSVGFDFFGFVQLSVSFYFDSAGNYWFYSYNYVQVGPDSFNIHGSLTLMFASSSVVATNGVGFGSPPTAINHEFELDVNGGVTAFDITNIISADVNVTITGTSVDMSVWAGISIDCGLFTIHIGGTVHIHLGTLNQPTPPPPPPIAQVGSFSVDGVNYGAGTLLLNVGTYATPDRNVPPQSTEDYTVTEIGPGTAGTVDLWVDSPGIYSGAAYDATTGTFLAAGSAPAGTVEYDNVSGIVAPSAGTSDTTIQIDPSVTVPVYVYAGSGTNQFYLGSNSSTVYGSSGNDTVFGGSGGVTFYAGSGSSIFNGGGTGSTHNTINDTTVYSGVTTATSAPAVSGPLDVVESGYSYYDVNGDTGYLYYGGSGSDATSNSTTINGSGVSVTITGVSSGLESFALSDYTNNVTYNAAGNSAASITGAITTSSGNLTVNTANNTNTITNSGGGTITLQNIDSSNTSHAFGALALNGGSSSANTFTVNSWAGGTLTLDGHGGNDIYNINFQSSGSFAAVVDGAGLAAGDNLNINGTSAGDTIDITSSVVTLGSQTVTYSSVQYMTINTAATGETIDIDSISATTTVKTGLFVDTINVGTNAITGTNSGGLLSGITTTLNFVGSSSAANIFNLDDSGDSTNTVGTLNYNSATGVSTLADVSGQTVLLGTNGSRGTITFSGVKTVNLGLGTGNNTFTVAGSSTATININGRTGSDTFNIQAMNGTVNLNTGTGTNIVNVGSNTSTLNPSNSITANIKGTLNVTGGGTTTLNVYDNSDANAVTGTLTGTSITGLGMGTGNINYDVTGTVNALNISLGSGGDTFTVTNTNSNTTTVLNAAGNNTVNVTTDSGATTINAQTGGDTVNISNDTATTTINGLSGTNTFNIKQTHAGTTINDHLNTGVDTINIGSNAPNSGGIVDNIKGAVSITGDTKDIVNVYDINSGGSKTADLTSTALTGMNMVAAGIGYSNLKQLNIWMGSGGNNVYIDSTAAGTTTTVNTGTGTNTVYIASNAFTPPGIVLSASPTGSVLSGIAGTVVVNGQGTDTLSVDDRGNGDAGSLYESSVGTASAGATIAQFTGLDITGNIEFNNVETANVNLANNSDIIYIRVNPYVTVMNITTGTGTNTIAFGSSAASVITTDTTTTDDAVGNQSNVTNSIMDYVQGVISITGSGNDTLNVDDSGSLNNPLNGGMWSNKLEFLDSFTATPTSSNPVIINFSGIANMTVSLSQAADDFVVVETFTSSSTSSVITIDGNGGSDNLINFDTQAVATINGGTGDDFFYNFGNSKALFLNGDGGDDTFYVYASLEAGASNVDPGGSGTSGNQVYSYRVNAPVYIDGGAGNNKVFIYATVVNDTITVNGQSVTGAGLDVNFVNIQSLTIAGLDGNDTFYIESITIPTTIIGDGKIVLPAVADFMAALNLTLPDTTGGIPPVQSYNDTFYVGWAGASYIPGSLSTITAPLTIIGDDGGDTAPRAGADNTIFVDDSADTQSQSFTLASGTGTDGGELTGTGFGAGGSLTYDDAVENLNFQLGNGNNTVTVDGNGTGTQTSVYGGRGANQFVVNDFNAYQWTAPVQLYGGLSVFQGNTLTVNGDATAGNVFNVTGYTITSTFAIDGSTGATVDYEQMQTLTIDAGACSVFNLNGDLVPTYLNGGIGADIFNVNSNITSLYLTSGTVGNDVYNINANAGMLTVTGFSSNNVLLGYTLINEVSNYVTINGNSGTALINGGPNGDTFIINGNSGGLTINGGAGCNTFTVNALSAPATLNGGIGTNIFTVNTPLSGVLTVNGGGNTGNWLTVNGTTGNDSITITSSSVSGIGSQINYNGTNLVVNGISGSDTFQVNSTSTFITDVNGGAYGNDTFNVESNTGILYLNGGSTGNNVFNFGSVAPFAGGVLTGLFGSIYITGGSSLSRLITMASSGINIVNIDDTGDTQAVCGILTNSTLVGLGMGWGITYTSIQYLNIKLGSGNDTFNVESTNSSTVTHLNTGSGADIVNVGSAEPWTGGIVDYIQGPLYVAGAGADTMNVDDTGSTGSKTGTLTATTLTGLGMGSSGIIYSGLSTLNISLGCGGNIFTIANTYVSTVTTLNSGNGNDIVNVTTDSDTTIINTQTGNDTVNVANDGALTTINNCGGNDTDNIQGTGATTDVNNTAGADTINIGSKEPLTGGVVNYIQGTINIVGDGCDTLNVDDTGSTLAKTGTLTSSTLTGLGMGSGGINYCGLSALNIYLGSGGNTFTIASTYASTVTFLNSGIGNDTVNVQSTAGITTVNTGNGTNTVNVGSQAPTIGGIVDYIQGPLTIVGDGNDTMNVDDTGNVIGKTGTLTSTTLTGLGMGNSGITYSGLAYLNISLSNHGNTFKIASTYVSTNTTLNTGGGNDTVYVQAISDTTKVITGAGINTIDIGNLMPTTGGIVDYIQGTLTIVGSGGDTMNVDDTGSGSVRTGTLTGVSLTGLNMGGNGIIYSGLATLNIALGSGGNTFTIASTSAGTVTNLKTGSGSDMVNVQRTSNITTVNTGGGINTVNIGSTMPTAGGIVDYIQGTLTIVGSGNDTMNVDDTGSTLTKTGTLTGITLTGLGMGSGGITYSGLATLYISLGSGGNTFTIANTNAGTVTTLNSGTGSDTVNVTTDSNTTIINTQIGTDTVNVTNDGALTNINTGGGNDTVNIQATSAVTNVNNTAGADTINIGSKEPVTGGNVNNIQGAVTVTGDGSDTINVDDTGSTLSKTGILTPSTLTGLGMGVSGITYTGLSALNIWLGSGGNTFTIANTFASTLTTLNSGIGSDTVNLTTDSGTTIINTQSGTDTVNVATDGGTTTINAGSGNDTVNMTNDGATTTINTGGGNSVVNIKATGATTNVNNSTGADTINISSKAPLTGGIVNNIQGTINVTGDGSDTMNVDDTGSTGSKTGTLTSNSLTGLAMGAGGITYSGLSALYISLGSGGNTFTITGTGTGTTTLNSGSGSDTVNVQATSGTTTVNTGTGTNTINIGSKEPTTGGVLNNILGALTINGSGNDTMNVDDTGSTAAKTGTLTATTLTGLNMAGITYNGLAALNISLGSGGTVLLVSSTPAAPTHINGGSGNDTFNVRATTGTLYLNGNGGNNVYNFGSQEPGSSGVLTGIVGAVYISGATSLNRLLTLTSGGTNIVNVDDTGDGVTRTGTLTSSTLTGLGLGAGLTFASVSTMNIYLGSGNDTFNVQSTYSTTVTTLNTGTGADIVNIGSAAPSASGILDNVMGVLTVTGNGNDTMNVDDTGSTIAKTGTLTATTLTGLNMAGITYSGVSTLNISLGSGGNTFTINGTSAANTNLNSGSGNDTVNVQATGGATKVNTGTGTNTINVGSTMPTTGGVLNNIQGALTVIGSGSDTMNVDDTGSILAKTGTLTATTLTGLGMAGITYSGLTKLNVSLGSGGNTFTISNTTATTLTTLNSGNGGDTVNLTTDSDTTTINTQNGTDTVNVTNDGASTTINTGGGNDTVNIQATGAATSVNNSAGADTINIGSVILTFGQISAGGVLSNIHGALTIAGSGTDTLNVDDSGGTTARTGTLTSSALTLTGVAGITYSGLSALNISLGSGGNTFTINNTNAATVTDLYSGAGNDTVNLTTDSSATVINTQTGADTVNVTNDGASTIINTGGGNDTVNIQVTNGITSVNNSAGTDTINIGSLAPTTTGGVINNIQGAISVAGSGSDILNVDDTGSTLAKTGTLTATTLTGLGMAGILYSGVSTLNISLGSGGNTFTITSTNVGTTTTLNSGSGNDTVTLVSDSSATNINTQAGNNVINVQATGATTIVTTGTGTNTVNVGSLAPTTTGGVVTTILGALTVVGSGNDTMNVDDSGSTANNSETLTATTITGMGMVAGGITYSGLATLNVSLGSGNDALTITSTTSTTTMTINGNGGTNTGTLNFSGNLANNLTLLNFVSATLSIGGNLSGQLTDAGAVTPVTIAGSLTSTGVLNVGSIATMTVGGNLAGMLTVAGALGTLTVSGAAPGQITVGSVNVINVLAGTGNTLLNLTAGGIQREILATPVAGGTMPNTVTFQFVYDATGSVPQVAIQITNTAVVARSFNLALVVTNSATAKFDLSILDSKSNAATGLSNISLQGDLLEGPTPAEIAVFTNLTLSSKGGIVLPADSITGVEVSNIIPIGYINVAGIEGVAFGVLTTATGTPVTITSPLGSASNIQVLWNYLGSTPTLNPANDAFVFSFNQTQSVRLFAHVDTNPDMELVMTLTAETTSNLPITANVQMVSTTNNSINPLVQSVTLTGAGGSINSIYSIANITSTGALGDVTITASSGSTVNNEPGLGNITAPSIFGSINVTSAGIYGTIQTTSGDIGQTILGTGNQITGVTTITSAGALTGKIISRGNLVSTVQATSSFSGVIAAQGSIGAIQTSNGNAVLTGNALARFGGITITGADSGQIIALGNVFGNVTISGSMTGRIAVEGLAVAGLSAARIGILGNVTATNNTVGSAIISGGLIGDSAGGTSGSFGNSVSAKVFLAADGAINLTSTTIAANNELQSVTGANLSALNAIFTNNSSALLFDTGGTLQGLVLIETDLANIQDNSGTLSGTVA
jgi:hypothetical protein